MTEAQDAKGLKAFATPAVAFLGILIVWEIVARTLFAGRHILAAPSQVLVTMWGDRALYPANIWATASEALRGWLLGSGIAVLTAVAFQQFRILERTFSRLTLAVYCLPITAVAPLLTLLLGGDLPAVTLAALWVYFPMLVNTLWGLSSADPAAIQVVHSLGGNSWSVLTKVRLRSAVPGVVAGLKIGCPNAVIAAVVAEWLGANRGLGVFMLTAIGQLQTERVWGILIVTAALAGGAYAIVALFGYLSRIPPAPTAPVGGSEEAGLAGRGRQLVVKLTMSLTSLLAIVAVWAGAIQIFHMDRLVAKTPADVWNYLATGPSAATDRSALFSALAETAVKAGVGLVVGVLVGVILAIAAYSLVPRAGQAIVPVAIALRTFPLIALAPLIVLVFGRGLLGTTVIVALIVFFPALVNTITGLQSATPSTMLLLKSYDASRWSILRKVELPSAIPGIVASLRIGVPNALIGATVAEWLATGNGIGSLMIQASFRADFNAVWAATVVLTAGAVIGLGLVQVLYSRAASRFSATGAA